MNRPFAPLVIFAFLSFTLISCGGGGSSTPPPPPPVISVSFATVPPTSMVLGAAAPIAVSVSNDSANAGVTFSCAPSGACGIFTSITSLAATYNAPAAVPSGGAVTITATSVTDSTKNAHQPININGPTITISFTSSFPASLPSSGTLPVNVSLTNDSSNQGVTFTCAPSGCGTFTNVTATSATYNCPASVPSGPVAVIATSVAQTSVSKSSPSMTITGTASNATLKGQYAFLVLSPTGDRGTAAWVGSVNLDGNGNLAAVGTNTFAGVEDVVSPVRNDQGDIVYPTATNPASHYHVDASGHGQITMTTGLGETLTIRFVITSANSSGVATHAEIIEADGNGGEAGDPGSGTLDLQDPTAFSNSQIARTYSFAMTGVQNTAGTPPESLGGVLNLSAPTAISGSVDIASGGTLASSLAGPGSQIDNAPDANGRGTFHVVLPGASTTRSITYYVVTSKVLRIFENSNISFTGGSMYSQGSATTALSGSYVYEHSGWSTAGRTVAAGQFSASSGTISSGISDANSGGLSAITPSTAKAVSGTYTASTAENGTINLTLTDAAGTSASTFNAYLVDPNLNILDPNSSTGGGGALLLHTNANINGMGLLVPQLSSAAFSLNHALNLINSVAATTPNEIDLVGLLTSDGAGSFGGPSNLADYTQSTTPNPPNPQLGATLSGTFATDASHSGRYTGSFSVTSLAGGYSFLTGAATATATPALISVAMYQATPTQAFIVETDNQAVAIGQMVQQNLP